MLSEKQLDANRANAQKSTGPKTEEGKKRSALNGFRHGLTGHAMVMPEGDMEAFNKMTSKLAANLNPVGDVEVHLAHSWATYQWRIGRIGAIEEDMFSMGLMIGTGENFNIEHPQAHNATSYAKTFRNDANEFGKLALYGNRLISQAEKVMKQFSALQAERKKQEQADMEQAVKIYEAHLKAEATFDPKAIGFGFSIEKIDAAYLRKNLVYQNFVAKKVKQARPEAA